MFKYQLFAFYNVPLWLNTGPPIKICLEPPLPVLLSHTNISCETDCFLSQDGCLCEQPERSCGLSWCFEWWHCDKKVSSVWSEVWCVSQQSGLLLMWRGRQHRAQQASGRVHREWELTWAPPPVMKLTWETVSSWGRTVFALTCCFQSFKGKIWFNFTITFS